MDWARDQLGDLVHASQRGFFNSGLTCPTCGQLVRRRAGAERRPHFAHYSNCAKPECENYHPSWHVTTPGGRQFKEFKASHPLCQGGIYYEPNVGGGYSLYLKLPQLSEGASELGEIEVHTGLGVRLYRAFQLYRPRFIPVIPELPLVEVKAFGELAAVGAAIRLIAESFRCSGNFFLASGVSSRLLAPEEPLEWGERYYLLTQFSLGSVPVGLGLKVETEVLQRGWYTYEITLPTLLDVDDHAKKEAITLFLGRIVKTPRARVYFIDPPPHHIELDGTYVFPELTGRILIRRTERKWVSLNGSLETVSHANVNEVSDEWVELNNIGAGNFMVLLDGGAELLGRVEKCKLFQPRGVRVTLGDHIWEIFEPELREVIRQGGSGIFRIECPSPRVADKLGLAQGAWLRDGSSFTLQGNNVGIVDAGHFGYLKQPDSERPNYMVEAVTPQAIIAIRIWLEGVVAGLYGPDAVRQLRKLWDKTLPMSLCSDLEWLRPYIVNAR